MKTKRMLLGVFAIAAYSVFAEDYSTWWQMDTSDNKQWRQSSYTRANWLNPEDPSAAPVSAVAGCNYYVPAGKNITSLTTSSTFIGDSLAVAGDFYAASSGSSVLTFNELRLLAGSEYRHSANNAIAGTVVCEGTQENPARIVSFIHTANYNYAYTAAFKSGGDGFLELGRSSMKNTGRDTVMTSDVMLSGDWSQFFGTLVIGQEVYATLRKNSGIYPGRIEVKTNAILSTSQTYGTFTVGSLKLNPGAELNVRLSDTRTCALYNVTNSFEASGAFRIGFIGSSFSITQSNYANGIPIIRLSGAAAESEPDLSDVVFANVPSRPVPRNIRLAVVDNGNGTKDIRVVWDPVTLMWTNNGSSDNSKMAFHAANGGYWSTGTVPDTDFDGDVYVTDVVLGFPQNADITYPYMRITMPSREIYAQSSNMTFGELNMCAGSSIFFYAGWNRKTLNGKLVLWPGSGYIRLSGWGGHRLTVNSEMSGSGDLKIYYTQTAYEVALTGMNTNFSGNIYLSSPSVDYDPVSGTNHTLYLSNGANLGGVYSGTNAWKSFMVDNFSKVVLADDVVLDEPTRGVFFSKGAQLTVPDGKRLEIDEQVTWGGRVLKFGDGTLVLGGKALFSDGTSEPSDTPVEGANLLSMEGGCLKTTSTNAVDGLAIDFAEGAAILVDPSLQDADVLAYGFVDLKCPSPLSTSAADGKIHVSLEQSAEIRGLVVDAGICTVSPEVAQDISFSLDNSIRGYRAQILSRSNPDGTVTFFVRCTHRGFILSLN